MGSYPNSLQYMHVYFQIAQFHNNSYYRTIIVYITPNMEIKFRLVHIIVLYSIVNFKNILMVYSVYMQWLRFRYTCNYS